MTLRMRRMMSIRTVCASLGIFFAWHGPDSENNGMHGIYYKAKFRRRRRGPDLRFLRHDINSV